MLLIFKLLNFLVNSFFSFSNELKKNIESIDGYKTIIYYKNINFSLLIEIKNKKFFIRLPKKKEKVHLLIKLNTRDFIKLLFEKKEQFRFDIIGEASIAEVFFRFFNFIKINWKNILLKKINNNYINILLRFASLTKKRILFNKYYIKKTIYKNLLNDNLIVSRYQIQSFMKINHDIKRKINIYKEIIKKMENKC